MSWETPVSDLPGIMHESLTWDKGSEMIQHAALAFAASLPVYFAHAQPPGAGHQCEYQQPHL
jgi:IS30 family transposase